MNQLFKYVSNHDYILEEGYIRATQLNALNDPFEAVYCEEGLSELSKYFDYNKKDRKNLIKDIETEKHKIGIISFTEAKDNLLMWSHYADEYKGSLLGIRKIFISESDNIFENLFPFSNESYPFNIKPIYNGEILHVKYRKQPMYKIDMFERDYSNISFTRLNQILYEIFQQKSEEWIYEKEHRIILRLEQADKVIIDNLTDEELNRLKEFCISDNSIIEILPERNKTIFYLDRIKDEEERSNFSSILSNYSRNPNNLYLFKLSSSSISSLTFGTKAKDSNFKKYLELNLNFEVYKAIHDKKTYTVNFEELYSRY